MPTWRPFSKSLLIAILAAATWLALPDTGNAGLFTKILKEAADGVSSPKKLDGKLATLDVPKDVASIVSNLPVHARKRSLISQATPEGHLRLTNASGETVTASTTEEVSSALKWLLPDTSDLARRNVDFYFSPDALTSGRPALNTLPRTARAHIVHGQKSYPVIGNPPFEAKTLNVRLRAGVVARASSTRALREAIWQLEQPLRASEIRVLSLDPATSNRLQTVRNQASQDRFESANPYDLAASMRALKRQTVILSGKIENKVLFFTPPGGKTQSVRLSDLQASAARDDVNLIVLDTDAARQPGVRNVLWQRTKIDGLEKALKSTTVGDFWSVLASGRTPLQLSVGSGGKTFISISANPRPSLAGKIPDDDNSLLTSTERLLEDVVANVSGNVITSGIEASLRSEARQQELELRIVPFLPALPQIFYIMALIVGFAGLSTIKNWWRKLWPLRDRASFGSTLGWLGNRILRGIPFVFVFMPLVAYVATPYQWVRGPIYWTWRIISAPFRWIWSRTRTV